MGIISEVYNEHCMSGMTRYPDKYFDLAVVDPPYFDGPQKLGYYGCSVSSTGVKRPEYKKIATWEVPGKKYIKELKRGSQSSRIAAAKSGMIYTGFEIDNEYFTDGCARFEQEARKIDPVNYSHITPVLPELF